MPYQQGVMKTRGVCVCVCVCVCVATNLLLLIASVAPKVHIIQGCPQSVYNIPGFKLLDEFDLVVNTGLEPTTEVGASVAYGELLTGKGDDLTLGVGVR